MHSTRMVILGNSGSGKSTLARHLAGVHGVPVLDLDSVAWESGKIAVARNFEAARADVLQFCRERAEWIVEGCYAQYAAVALSLNPEFRARGSQPGSPWTGDSGTPAVATEAVPPALGPELVFLDPGLDRCLANCRNRPWEPHKYASKADQDARLAFLLEWVADYYRRDDDLSWRGHYALFEAYEGPKRWLTDVPEQGG